MNTRIPVFIGTYTETLPHVAGKGPGIAPCALDLATGEVTPTGNANPVRNPAYLWRSGNILYSTSEICDFRGNADGSISVLHFNPKTAELSLIQETSSSGSGPAWAHGDASKTRLLVANYVEGNIAVFPIHPNARLGDACDSLRYTGMGPDLGRQEAPHPHAMLSSPDNRHVYVADLGTDRIHGYDFNPSSGTLSPLRQGEMQLPPASGPRHLLFHPGGRFLCAVLELSSELAVLERNPADGSLKTISIHASVPGGTGIANHPSEIALSGDERHLYMANRGHQSIAHFHFDPDTGACQLLSTTPCGGRIPRHIALSPDDCFLLVANQESDEVLTFRRSPESGDLIPTEHALPIGTPCFVCF